MNNSLTEAKTIYKGARVPQIRVAPRDWEDDVPTQQRLMVVLTSELKQLRDIADEIDRDSTQAIKVLRTLEKRGIVKCEKRGPNKRDAVFFRLASG